MAAATNSKATNQSPPLSGHNAFRLNPLLLQITSGFDAKTLKDFDQIGHYSLSAEAQDLANMANANPPILKTHDRFGNRIDHVVFHPSYHALMRRSVAYGLSSSVWEDAARGNANGHLKRAIRLFMMAGLEAGHIGSLSTTNGAVATLMTAPHLANEWVPRVTTRNYDSANKSPVEKNCLTIGLGIAEKQAGTDISAISTRAEPVGNGLFRLNGHKWFLSSPMADAFIMLARSSKGVSCFLVPRYLADDEHNRIQLIELKEKLGNRSAATAQVEMNGVVAQMIGRDGDGLKAINEMLTLTRLDSAVISSGMMHSAMAEAVNHAHHRRTGGKALVAHPLMTRVLADMAIDVAASTALSLRIARAFDAARENSAEGLFAHAMIPIAKYWSSKLAPNVIAEAMEAIGGNGYVETSVLPRHYREAPHQTIWEGTGNMMALDAVGFLTRSPQAFEAIVSQLGQDLGARGPQTIDVLRAAFKLAMNDPGSARIVTEQLAIAAAAAELTRLGTGSLADTFIETRLSGAWRSTYGMLDSRFDSATILHALYPPLS